MIKKIITLIIISMGVPAVFADQALMQNTNTMPYVFFNVGLMDSLFENNQSLPLGSWGEEYHARIRNASNYTLGFGLPFTRFLTAYLAERSSVEAAISYGEYGVEGNHDEIFTFPPYYTGLSNQSTYAYNVSNLSLLFNYRFNILINSCFVPFIFVGAGFDRYTTTSFSETIPDSTFGLLTAENFDNNTHTNFAYNAGLGVDYIFASNFKLGLGYRYFNGGTASTGAGNGVGAGPNYNLALSSLQIPLSFNEFYASIAYTI